MTPFGPHGLKDHAELLTGIKAVLVGKPVHLQGTVLAEALALWLAGHPDFTREDVLAVHIDCVRHLIPEVEREIFNGGGHPQNRGRR